MKTPIIIAHRGASAYAPENTMSSFKKAMELNADGIELDIHMTIDGHMVVIHDAEVNRTSSGTGRVKEMTLEQLRELDFGSWFSPQFQDEKILTLEQVLAELSSWDGLLNIEIKNQHIDSNIEEKVIDLIYDYKRENKTIISSFGADSLKRIKKIDNRIKTALLYGANTNVTWEYLYEIGVDAIHPHFSNVNAELVALYRQKGIAINTYTVDNPDTMVKMCLDGVNGIITNAPDIAKKITEAAV